jgi:Mg-chelatase subunit ChlD
VRSRLAPFAAAIALALPCAAWGDAPEPFAPASVASVAVDDVFAGADGVAVSFRALSADGRPVEHLRAADVRIVQDGAALPEGALKSLERVDETGRGLAVVLALDNSRPLLGDPFDRARAQALAFVAKLAPPDQAALVSFSGSAQVVVPFGESLEEVRERIEGLAPDKTSRTTAVFDGIHQAAELLRTLPTLPRSRFVVAFSHGRDGGGRHRLEDVIELAEGAGGEPRIPIFTIGYAGRGEAGLPALERLASATGARSARENDATSLYAAALAQMRGSYVARFETDLDGAPHRVAVEVEGRSSERAAVYPIAPRSPAFQTPWQPLALGAAAVLAGLAFWMSRRSRGEKGTGGTLTVEPGTAEPGPRLRFLDGPLAGRSVPLGGGRTRIGALAENDVAIPAPSVSRAHAEIRAEGKGFTLVDLGSTNGTRVNGSRVEKARLRPGDRIRLGEVELVFEG